MWYLKENQLCLYFKFYKDAGASKVSSIINIWADASFADDYTDRKSTLGNLVCWNNYIISWKAHKSKTNVLSTAEAELLSAAEALWSGLYLMNLNKEIFKFPVSLCLYEDNQTCIKWLKNPIGYMEKTKHIDLSYNFIRNYYIDGNLDIICVETKNQNADMFTKALDKNKLQYLLERLPIKHLHRSGELLMN